MRSMRISLSVAASVVALFAMGDSSVIAQEDATTKKSESKIVTFSTREDHQNMQKQLGITKLRPGPSGTPTNPNAANTDEAKANPYPKLPELMTLKNGQKVTTADQWWKQRRPEIVEDFEREVLGRIPKDVPDVKWEVLKTVEKKVGETDVVEKRLAGRVDNSGCEEIDVNIMMSVVTPKDAKGPVPVLMMFGFTMFGPDGEDLNFGGRRFGGRRGGGPSKTEQLIEAGWGYATINAGSIQDDSGGERQRRFGPPPPAGQTGGGLTRGIIGLTNKGQPRKPDQWGSLRAWGWGASRGLDYLETYAPVDAKRVGIDGVSRYGKAALVTMAFDQRFASALVGSSGEGGASLYRRNFGEAVENLTGSGEYHWMAGNFLKYGTAESSSGSKNSNDLPVDAHMLIALCAPRPTFISYGIPEKGDALWLDQQGSFMATVAAQPAFRLLGARDLGRSDDYNKEKMPPVNTDLLDGELGWRQHDGGHTELPNIKHFVKWADKLFAERNGKKGAAITRPASKPTAHAAVPRNDQNSRTAHKHLLAKTKQGTIDVYFQGDSILRRWGATDYPKLLANWKKNFHGWNAADFAWGGDTTHNILWRMQNGELEGVNPKVVVLQAGTNNLPWRGSARNSTVEDVVSGIEAILDVFQAKIPDAKIVLTAVFPRSQNIAVAPTINTINKRLETLATAKRVRFLNINDKLGDDKGQLLPGMSDDGLHLSEQGYQVWADALKPILTEFLGAPAKADHAPPATGNPAASKTARRRPKENDKATTSTGTGLRGSYYADGKIYVGEYGTPEGKPLTAGHWDFKPSWSKTGDMLVFFRRLKNDRDVSKWKTAIHIINADGTGLHQLTDGKHTDFNQTWTRDGTNTPIWNRKHPKNGGYTVMAGKVGGKPGEEIALTASSHHTWAYTCLIDGRILVRSNPPKQGMGYYLMTPNAGGKPKFERIKCELAKRGVLDRVSLSPSETKVCFEFQTGFKRKVPGRTLYIADFDPKQPSITKAQAFANKQGKSIWYAYPRWSRDESSIVYHAGGKLFLYTLADSSTKQVSTNAQTDYRYPHMAGAPK